MSGAGDDAGSAGKGYLEQFEPDLNACKSSAAMQSLLAAMTRGAQQLPVAARPAARHQVTQFFINYRDTAMYADIWVPPVPTQYKDLLTALASTEPPSSPPAYSHDSVATGKTPGAGWDTGVGAVGGVAPPFPPYG